MEQVRPTVVKPKFNMTIQGLRGLAASLVLYVHLFTIAPSVKIAIPASAAPAILDRLGEFGVFLFFCISGYLISQTLLARLQYAHFFKNRVARIYPVFLFVLLIRLGSIFVFHFHLAKVSDLYGPEGLKYFLANLFFVQGFLKTPSLVPSAWSLSYEWLFYFFVAGSALLTITAKNRVVKTVGTVVVIGVGAYLCYLLFGLIFFLVGFLVLKLSNTKFLERQSALSYFDIPLLLLTYYFVHVNSYLCFLFVFPLFFFLVKETGVLPYILRTRLFQFLGRISYSLYMLGPIATYLSGFLIAKLSHGTQSPKWVIGYCIGSVFGGILMAYLSYRFIETDLTQLIFGKRQKPSPSASAT